MFRALHKTSLVFIACINLITLAFAGDSAQELEHQVKAAFIYKFIKFVDWPNGHAPAKNSPLVIGISGPGPINDTLNSLAGKQAKDYRVTVETFGQMPEAPQPHILFINTMPKDRLANILSQLRKKPVLTVSDSPGFAEAGVMINFTVVDEKVRFEVNQAAANKAGLEINPQLLRLAKSVISE